MSELLLTLALALARLVGRFWKPISALVGMVVARESGRRDERRVARETSNARTIRNHETRARVRDAVRRDRVTRSRAERMRDSEFILRRPRPGR